MKRPLAVSIISWYLLVAGCASVGIQIFNWNHPLVLELMSKSPIPIPVQRGLSFLSCGILIISSLAMLNGKNWGRWLYIVPMGALAIAMLIVNPSMSMIPSLIAYLVVTCFLVLPNATAYFTQSRGDHAASV